MFIEIAGIVVLLFVLEWLYQIWFIKPCVGDSGLPLIYNMIAVLNRKPNPYDYMMNKILKHGKIFCTKVSILTKWTVTTADVEIVDYILRKNFDNYVKGKLFQTNSHEFLGDGIFAVSGDKWYVQRKTASHLFKKKLLRNFVKVYNKHNKTLLKVISQNLGKETDMQKVFNSFTLDTICDLGFDFDLQSMLKETTFQKAFDGCNQGIMKRFLNPYWKWIPLQSEKEYKEYLKIIDTLIFEIIDKRLKLVKEGKEWKKDDILGLYLTAKDENGNSFDRNYLRNVITNFLLAGRDTTGQTLTWCFHFLSQTPSVEKKLREELSKLKKQDEDFAFEDLEALPYLKAVINETLRLAPPVPIDGKEAKNDDTLPGGIKVKKGMRVSWNAWCLGRHPDYFGDPLVFKPERWFSAESNGGKPIPNDKSTTPPFVPFQMGPRICLGQKLAMDELMVTIANVITNFTFEPTERSINVQPQMGLTLSAKGGMWLIPKKL